MSEASKDFLKELRKGVTKKGWSNGRIHRFLNDIFDAGYAQGLKYAQKSIQGAVENAYQVPDTGNNADGVGGQSDSPIDGGGSGSDADNADSGKGSTTTVQFPNRPTTVFRTAEYIDWNTPAKTLPDGSAE